MPEAIAPSRASFESYVCVMRIVVTPPFSANSCVSTSEPIVLAGAQRHRFGVNDPLVQDDLREHALERHDRIGLLALPRQLSAPPTRGSHSQTVMVHPGGGSIQRRILSGVNIASHTSRRGALNVRVRTMVVSVGVEI